LQQSSGNLGFSSGTSFSSPVLAGMAACLWQAFPYTTAVEVKQAIELSSSQYNEPDTLVGYGIPDFGVAWNYLLNTTVPQQEIAEKWSVYPNPIGDHLVLQQKSSGIKDEVEIEIFSIDGRLIKKWIKAGTPKIVLNGLQSLPSGVFLLKVNANNSSETIKLFKQR
jgi:hypothetical protein